MISIDRVYQTVLTFSNTDVRGNITPKDARLLINDSVNEIYEEYLLDVNKFVNRENRGLVNNGIENLPDRLREKLLHFLVEKELVHSTDHFELPSDMRYFDSVYHDDTEVEQTKNAKEFKLVSRQRHLVRNHPIYLQIGAKIRVAPESIDADVVLFYLRQPKIANWTYSVVGTAEVFNPSLQGFQDIDLHASEESNVVLRTCLKAGINLKEQDLKALMQAIETRQLNKENIT